MLKFVNLHSPLYPYKQIIIQKHIYIMKIKTIIFVPVLGLIMSCSGNSDKSAEASEALQEEIEILDESSRRVESVIDSSGAKIESLQDEVDELLNEL